MLGGLVHVRTAGMQTALFIVCTVPFWTSNVIRMISWVPLLGRNGLVNQGLTAMGVIDKPLDWLLFSDFSVVLAFVHRAGISAVDRWKRKQARSGSLSVVQRVTLHGVTVEGIIIPVKTIMGWDD